MNLKHCADGHCADGREFEWTPNFCYVCPRNENYKLRCKQNKQLIMVSNLFSSVSLSLSNTQHYFQGHCHQQKHTTRNGIWLCIRIRIISFSFVKDYLASSYLCQMINYTLSCPLLFLAHHSTCVHILSLCCNYLLMHTPQDMN